MNGAGSHVSLLAAVVAIARPGPVLELGVGECSTPLLREMCKAMRRELVSVDNHPEWAAKFDACRWGDGNDLSRTWSVVFIDTSAPPTRLDLVQMFRARAEFIVVHDTDNQSGDLDDLILALDGFPFQYTADYSTPWTTVVSETRGYP